jgi:hypothetical protein
MPRLDLDWVKLREESCLDGKVPSLRKMKFAGWKMMESVQYLADRLRRRSLQNLELAAATAALAHGTTPDSNGADA